MNENIENATVETSVEPAIPATNEGSQGQPEKTYTEAEVQSMIDRRITQAVKTVSQKYEKKLSLANLDENQRRSEEQRMHIEELELKLKDYECEKNPSEIKNVLSGRHLPTTFADLIHIGEDYDEALAAIDTFDKAFKEAVAEEVKRRLASNAPAASNAATPATDFDKMNIVERQKLYTENPELYKKLAGM